jgi:hypothetical protein
VLRSPNTEAAIVSVTLASALIAAFIGTAAQQSELATVDDSQMMEMASGAAAQMGAAASKAFSDAAITGSEFWDGSLETNEAMAEEVLIGDDFLKALQTLLSKLLPFLRS